MRVQPSDEIGGISVIQVRVEKVGMDLESKQAVVLLKEFDGRRLLPIVIGTWEASSIALQMEGATPARPLTHDLMKSVLEALRVEVSMVIITEIKENTFYAQLVLQTPDGMVEVDCRPSDAIALALRTSAPIFVAESVLHDAGVAAAEGEDEPEASD